MYVLYIYIYVIQSVTLVSEQGPQDSRAGAAARRP